MPRRRDLRGAAAGLLGAFMSRNNDVGGYWALGKLYSHARTSNVLEVRIDLVSSIIDPPDAEFDDMLGRFQRTLVDQLAARSLPREWLMEANVSLTFYGEESPTGHAETFACSVTLTDDLGRAHQAQGGGACWIHNPAWERKSTRAPSVSGQ